MILWKNAEKELKGQTIGMTHGDDLETAEALKALITERFGCEVFIVNTIGAAIGHIQDLAL